MLTLIVRYQMVRFGAVSEKASILQQLTLRGVPQSLGTCQVQEFHDNKSVYVVKLPRS
jgi:hypothetical protein